MSDKKAIIKNADMSDDMQQDAVGYAMQAMEKYNIEKDIAASVKKACQIRSQTCFISDNWWWLHDFVYWFCLFIYFIFLQEFDKKYNPTWHCIVGRNFGSYVTHETKHFIYFYLGQVAILLFKSGWNANIPLFLTLLLIQPFYFLPQPLWKHIPPTAISSVIHGLEIYTLLWIRICGYCVSPLYILYAFLCRITYFSCGFDKRQFLLKCLNILCGMKLKKKKC